MKLALRIALRFLRWLAVTVWFGIFFLAFPLFILAGTIHDPRDIFPSFFGALIDRAPGPGGRVTDSSPVAPGKDFEEDASVIETLDDMPEGVLGFRVSGEVSRADYDEVLMPPIRALIEGGGKVRAVCQIGPEFHGYDKDADWEDVKKGAEWGIGPHDDWHRIAVVTDEKKLRKATRIFGWLAPGEAKLFRVSEVEQAAAWAADGYEDT